MSGSGKTEESRSNQLLIRLPLELLTQAQEDCERHPQRPPTLLAPIYVDLERTPSGYKLFSAKSRATQESHHRRTHTAKIASSSSNDGDAEIPKKQASGPRQYLCEVEGCGKRFLDNSKLRRHMLVHTVRNT